MSVLPTIASFFLVSIFWVLAFVKLQKQEGGILFFLKHFGGAIATCLIIVYGFLAIIDSDVNVGFEVFIYLLAIMILIAVVWFIWSLVVFIKARNREKAIQSNTVYEDILDDNSLK